ncbi:hypothetical protein GPAL_0480 [Glaciecola pallidula DSM 14239 = ACAM 615]|uniref:Uncharacterized protein n=1 Tax=Brumicola pallidula DSM 14239 = ACAM 615 TaxID=1121922 RepID=K6ZVJ5_9ALTE|nr:hypothetical protein GPAL_0480 [Glaciecola pallidula DSM 14239 = ACAM 615]
MGIGKRHKMTKGVSAKKAPKNRNASKFNGCVYTNASFAMA